MNLLDLMVKVGIDDQVTGKLGSLASSAKGALGTAAKAATAAAAAAVAGVGVVGKAALDSYASYEQLVGGVDKLFGDASKQLQQYAAEAYETSGMSANQYMEQATSFSAALIQSLGGDTAKAAEQADVAMRAMSDNANVFGSQMEDIQNAFQGFAKQNYTMLDNLKLGYGGTKEEMQRLIDDANAYAESIGQASDLSIDSFSDIVTAIQLVQEQQGIAGTTAREAATTIEGSVNMAKAAWANWLTELGKDNADMAALTEQLVDSIAAAAGNIVPRLGIIVGTAVGTLPGLVMEVGPELGAALSDTLSTAFDTAKESLPEGIAGVVGAVGEKLGELVGFAQDVAGRVSESFADIDLSGVEAVVASVVSFAEEHALEVEEAIGAVSDAAAWLVEHFDELVIGVGALTGAFTAFKASLAVTESINGVKAALVAFKSAQEASTLAQALLNAVMNANPFVIVATLIGILVGVLVTLWTTNEEFRNAVIAAWEAVKEAAATAWGAVCDFFTVTVPNAINEMMGWFQQLPGRIKEKWDAIIQGVAAWASQMGSDIVSFASSIPGKILDGIGDLGSLLWNAGVNLVQGFVGGVKSMASSLISAVTGPIGDAVSKAKSLLGIASPSKVFRQIGDYAMQGLELGIGGGAADAVSAMESAVRDVVGAASFSVPAPALAAAPAMAAGATYNVYVDGSLLQVDSRINDKLSDFVDAVLGNYGR